MQYELWRSKNENGEMGQIYLINPKSPLDRVNREDIMQSGGVCVGQLESELDARQMMEGFTYFRDEVVFYLREVIAKLDKDLKDTKYTPEIARVRAKAVTWEVLENFKYVDRMRAKEYEGESPYPDGDMSIEACPCCGSGEYLHNQDENRNEYCGQCGQRIKWD